MTEPATKEYFESMLEEVFKTDEQTAQEPAHYVHIINPVDNMHVQILVRRSMTAKEIADFAKVNGVEIVALCGYHFVPSRNPEVVNDTCPICLDVAGMLMRNAGE